MCTVPAYNKPTQIGLYEHFKSIHDATLLPIMLYTVPSRTGADFTDETILKLALLPRIVAMKDAGSDIERVLRLSSKLPDFAILSGDDATALAFNAQGGLGLVSVASNIIPGKVKQIHDLWSDGDIKQALRLQQNLVELYHAMFVETNPTPVKYAASLLELCTSEVRLPLYEASNINQKMIAIIVERYIKFCN
jgi:4-hydroxy-tetrahydrodipicolinate synthase